MSLLYHTFAQPIAPPEIVKRLQQVDDRLNLRYVSFPSRDGINMNLTENWAIIQRWGQNDPRRRMIQLGQMPAEGDFDIIAWLPIDCSAEQAFGFFERACKGHFRDNTDIEHMLNNLHKWNAGVQKEVLKPVVEHAEEMIEANTATLFEKEGKTIPKVFMSGGDKKK